MKDEISKEIVDELRLIREDLQNLTMAIRSKTSNFENSYAGKSRKSYQPRVPYPPIRNSFVLWQLLGIADLVIAVIVGTTAGLISPQGPSMVPLTVLPLSLIPTFLVPLFVILHVICIRPGEILEECFRANSSHTEAGSRSRNLNQ